MKEKIKNNLKKDCSFLSAWNQLDETTHSVHEMGYVRAYNNRFGWADSTHIVHKQYVSKDRYAELMQVSKSLMSVFPTLDSLDAFCQNFAEALPGKEYNLYYEGNTANFWIRAIPRSGDYNLYIHSIAKEGS